MDAVTALKASPLFKGFSDNGLQIFASIATLRTFPQSAALFVENAESDALFIVASGTVKLTSKSKTGQEVFVGELASGDYLGELSIVHLGLRMCTAVASSPVSAFEIRHAEFQKLLATKPQACMKLLMGICSHFAQKVYDNKDALKSLLPKG